MRRRLFNFACAASMLLCVAEAALWARSYWAADVVHYRGGPPISAASSAGGVGVVLYRRHPYQGPRPSWQHLRKSLAPLQRSMAQPYWQGLGFGYGAVWRGKILLVPHWFLLLLTLALPAAWAFGWERRRLRDRSKLGLCLRCGYDLRASEGRCPECGASIPPRGLGARPPAGTSTAGEAG